jgi:cytochrome P450
MATLSSFLLVLLLYPDVQKRATDRVVGRMHLPSFNDRPKNIPFVEAIYKELLRWRMVFRLDVSRSAMENETCMTNTLFPKRKIVIPNSR